MPAPVIIILHEIRQKVQSQMANLWQDIQYHVNYGCIFILLPSIRFLLHLFRFGFCLSLNSKRLGLAFHLKHSEQSSTLCLKKRTNFETAQFKIITIDFDEIWLKCSKDSRIQFACFSFHVGLVFYQLFVFQTGHQK